MVAVTRCVPRSSKVWVKRTLSPGVIVSSVTVSSSTVTVSSTGSSASTPRTEATNAVDKPTLAVEGPDSTTARSVSAGWTSIALTVAFRLAADSAVASRLRPAVTRPSERRTTVPFSRRFATTPSPIRESVPVPTVARVTGTPVSSISATRSSVTSG
jgi:hypothetical protein